MALLLRATKGSDGSEITRRLQRPQLGLRTADQGHDLNVGDNVFHLNHNIAPSGRGKAMNLAADLGLSP